MNLVDAFKEEFVLMEKSIKPDGEGGYVTTWTPGVKVSIAADLNSTMEAKIAEKDGVTSVYTLTFSKSAPLAFNDYVRREKDQQVFRITSNPEEKKTPDQMAVQFMQASAEKTVLPK